MNDGDRLTLVGFLQGAQPQVQTAVTMLVQFYEESDEDLAVESAQLVRAWEAVTRRPDIGQAIERVESREYDRALEAAGLVGPELEFKLSGIPELADDAERSLNSGGGPRSKRGLKLFRLLLLRIDAIWKSVVASLGVGEAFGEFKEVLELKLEQLTT